MDTAATNSTRRPLSVRTRFEVFKRDDFTCQYCGRKSPEVVLEVDHIIPICDGGTDDPVNLIASCWECNHGKAGIPLASSMTGEDPHDRAIEILERQRQLQEYNRVLTEEYEKRQEEAWNLWRYWQTERGYSKPDDLESAPKRDLGWLMSALVYCPSQKIIKFMDLALSRGMYKNLRYVGACVRNWRYEHQANRDTGVNDLP